jgi:hypothetical protein
MLRLAEKKARRARLEAELGARQRALPDKRYGVIYADPPWRFEPYSRVTGMDRAPRTTIRLALLLRSKRSMSNRSQPPTACCSCGRRLPCSTRRLRSWRRGALPTKPALCGTRTGSELDTGFATSTRFCWSEHAGMSPAMGTQWPLLLEAPVGRHSEKPTVCEIIEIYFPTPPKIELHARGVVPRPGWDVWGLEAPTCADHCKIESQVGEVMSPTFA